MPDAFEEQLVYSVPEMTQIQPEQNIVYRMAGAAPLLMDVYRPRETRSGDNLPAVVFVHGEAQPGVMDRAKDWGQYRCWAQLAAVNGLVGITFTHRSLSGLQGLETAAADVECLIEHVRMNAPALNVDPDRLCIWTCSAGGPVGLYAALKDRPAYIRSIVSYYAFMDLQHLRSFIGKPIPADVTGETLRAYSPLWLLETDSRPVAPLLVFRAGRDEIAQLNESIDRFVAGALHRNEAFELIAQPDAQHGFDLYDDTEWARRVIRHTLAFIKEHMAERRCP